MPLVSNSISARSSRFSPMHDNDKKNLYSQILRPAYASEP
jgi:hypothetical protein